MLRIRHFNNACLAKFGWKILADSDNWWVKIVKQKYMRHGICWRIRLSNIILLSGKEFINSINVIMKGLRWLV